MRIAKATTIFLRFIDTQQTVHSGVACAHMIEVEMHN